MPREDISAKLLRAFVAVADEGSFTGAAAREAVSQPTVSHRIAIMEKAIGARLFVRRRRGDHLLTETGHGLLPHARSALAAHDRMIAWIDGRNPIQRLW